MAVDPSRSLCLDFKEDKCRTTYWMRHRRSSQKLETRKQKGLTAMDPKLEFSFE